MTKSGIRKLYKMDWGYHTQQIACEGCDKFTLILKWNAIKIQLIASKMIHMHCIMMEFQD